MVPPEVEVWVESFRETDRLYRARKIGAVEWETRLSDVKPMPRRVPVPGSLFCPACERNVLVTADGRLWRHRTGPRRADPACKLSQVSLMAMCTCVGTCKLVECQLCSQLPAKSPCPEEVAP